MNRQENRIDEEMLKRFFSDAATQRMEDDDFVRRVARRLPERVNWLDRLFTTGCLLVTVILFIACGGMKMLWDDLGAALLNITSEGWMNVLPTLLLGTIALLTVGCYEVFIYVKDHQ